MNNVIIRRITTSVISALLWIGGPIVDAHSQLQQANRTVVVSDQCPIRVNGHGYAYDGFIYRLTDERYDPTAALYHELKSKYGTNVEIADWNVLKGFLTSASTIREFVNQIGIARQGGDFDCDNILIGKGGQLINSGKHYLLAWHNGVVPPGWAVLDSIGANDIDLGRWNHPGAVLLKIPVAVSPKSAEVSKNEPAFAIQPQPNAPPPGPTQTLVLTIPPPGEVDATGPGRHAASSDKICQIFSLLIFKMSLDDLTSVNPNYAKLHPALPRANPLGSIADEAQARNNAAVSQLAARLRPRGSTTAAETLREIETAQKTAKEAKLNEDLRFNSEFNDNLSACLRDLHSTAPKTYDVIKTHFLPYISANNSTGEHQCYEEPDTLCANFDYNGNIYAELMTTERFLNMLSSEQTHSQLSQMMGQAATKVSLALKEKQDYQAAKKQQEQNNEQQATIAAQRGHKYADQNETVWTLATKKDEMTDQLDVTAVSLQYNDAGADALVTAYCAEPHVLSFDATIIDEDGKPTLSIPNIRAGQLITTSRINDEQPNTSLFPTHTFNNRFLIARFASKASKIFDLQENHNSDHPEAHLPGDLLIALSNVFPLESTWRYMIRIPTSKGDVIVKLPLYQDDIKSVADACELTK